MKELVVLVDRHDRKIGTEEKLAAHRNGGKLHRSISIIIFNRKGQMMLQRRAMGKYHSPGLWTNTCCSHTALGETALQAAHRRLKQEMGFDCRLEEAFTFIYKVPVGNGLTESEYDHVIFGIYDKRPRLNPKEAMDWKWAEVSRLKSTVRKRKSAYTGWFNIIMTNGAVTRKLNANMKRFLKEARAG